MEFLKDVTHPDMFNATSGDIDTISGLTEINQSIAHILQTEKGELWGDPTFGTNLHSYLFSYSVQASINLIKDDIVDCLNEQEPRIYLTRDMITVIEHQPQKALEIQITYQIKSSDQYANYSYMVSTEQGV